MLLSAAIALLGSLVLSDPFDCVFRSHDSLHKNLSGFDFKNGLYYYNVGEGFHRNWDDYVEYGFISAGQAPLVSVSLQCS